MRVILTAFALSALCVLSLTGCSESGRGDLVTDFGTSSSRPTTPAGPSDREIPAETVEIAVPDGFSDVNTGLAVKWVNSPECGTTVCQQIEVFALKRCPSRVYLEANVLDVSKRVLGETHSELGGLPQGQTGLITFTIAQPGAQSLDLVEVDCN
jgi:hypothetical protein